MDTRHKSQVSECPEVFNKEKFNKFLDTGMQAIFCRRICRIIMYIMSNLTKENVFKVQENDVYTYQM